jgi:hypothetical protein
MWRKQRVRHSHSIEARDELAEILDFVTLKDG